MPAAAEGLDVLFEIYHRVLTPMLVERRTSTHVGMSPYVLLTLGEVAGLISRRIESAVVRFPSVGCWISADEKMIACYRCGRISHNRGDIENHYCPRCHVFHSDEPVSFRVHRQAAL